MRDFSLNSGNSRNSRNSMNIKKIPMKIFMTLLCLIFLLPLLAIFIQADSMTNWCYVFMSPRTYEAVQKSTIIVFIAIVINVILGTPVASLMAKEEFRGKKALELLILLPLIIPGFVTTMGIQFLFIRLDLIETLLGVGIVHALATLPYFIRSLRAGYSTINRDYEKMGRLMGASSLQIFFKINLPMLVPAFVAGISLIILVSFAQYLVTLIIGGGEVITLPVLMFPFLAGGDMKIGAVYSILYILMNVLLILFLEKAIEKIYSRKEIEENYDRD